LVAADERFTVTGFVAGDFGGPLAGDKDLIAAQFDADGNVVWANQLGTALNDKGADIKRDGAGNLVVAGYSDGSLAGSAGRFDVVVITFSPEGEMLSIRQLGTPEDDGADEFAEENLFLAVEGDTLALTGLTLGQVGDSAPNGGSDVFLIQLPLE